MMPLYLGCTRARHCEIGVNAIVNARAGQQSLNDLTQEDIELARDAEKIRRRLAERVRFYQFTSRFFRRKKNLRRVAHLLSRHDD